MNNITTIGIDLAKNVFQLHCNDRHGKKVISKRLSREQLPEFIVNLTDHVLVSRTVNISNLWETTNVQNTKLSIGI